MIKAIIILVVVAALVSGAFALYAYKYGNDDENESGTCRSCGLQATCEIRRKNGSCAKKTDAG